MEKAQAYAVWRPNGMNGLEVTHHAVIRFLQRVMKKSRFTQSEFAKAYLFLQKSFANVVTHRSVVPFPQIKGYVAIVRDNSVVTVIEKNRAWKKSIKHRYGYTRGLDAA